MQTPTGRGYSSYKFLAPDGGEWSASRPGRALPPGKGPQYALDRRLDGPQSWSGHRGYRNNNLPLPQIEPRLSSVYLLEVSQVVPSLEAFQPKWSKPRYFSFPPSVLCVSPISTFIQSPHNIRRRQQIVTLHKMQFSSLLCYFAFHEQVPLIRSWTMNN
jgi:hypothetical protein